MAINAGTVVADAKMNMRGFMRDLAVMKKSGTKAADRIGKKYKRLGGRMQSIGRSMTMSLTAPLAAMGAASVKAFSTFDSEMTKSTAIMGNVSNKMRKQMEAAAMSVSEDLNMASSKAAESFFFLASAGLDAEQSVSALPQVAEFAKAGMFDMATATDLATDAQSALGLTVDDAAENMRNMKRVTDVLVKANTLANASVQQFSESLTNRAAAALRSVNKEVEEGVAVLSAFADQGLKGRRSGEQLARILRIISQQAAQNKQLFKDLGIIDASGNLASMSDIIKILTQEMKGLSDAEKSAKLEQLGFTARVQASIKPLLGTSQQIKEYKRQLQDAGGITKEVADKQMKSFSQQLGQTWQMIKNVGIEIGESLVPTVSMLNDMLRTTIKWWRGLSDTGKTVIGTITGLTAVVGPLVYGIGSLVKILPSVTSALAALGVTGGIVAGLATAVGLLGAAWVAHNSKISKAESKLNGMENMASSVAKKFVQNKKDMLEYAESVGKAATEIEGFSEAFQNMQKNLQGRIQRLNSETQSLAQEYQGLKEEFNAKGVGEARMREITSRMKEIEQQIKSNNKQVASYQQGLFKLGGSLQDVGDDAKGAGNKIKNIFNPHIEEARKQMNRLAKQEFDADKVIDPSINLENMEVPDVGKKMFPPGSLGFLQDKMKQLRKNLRGATDPQRIEELKNKIGLTKKQMEKFRNEAKKSGNVWQGFARVTSNALEQAVIHGKSLGSILGSLAKQLASKAIMTGLSFLLPGGAVAGQTGFFSTMFGGMFHSGGMVPGSGDKMIKAKGGEMVLTQGQQRALGSMMQNGSRQKVDLNVQFSGRMKANGRELTSVIEDYEYHKRR